MSEAFPRRQRRLVCYDANEIAWALEREHVAGARRAAEWIRSQYGDTHAELVEKLRQACGGWKPR